MLVCVSHRVTDGGRDVDDLLQGQSLARAVERFENRVVADQIGALYDSLMERGHGE